VPLHVDAAFSRVIIKHKAAESRFYFAHRMSVARSPHEGRFGVRPVSDLFHIRRATVADADIIASHRARMFRDMGDVSGEAFEMLLEKAKYRLTEWLASGDYLGWLAAPSDQPRTIVAGAGLQLQPILPRPRDPSTIGEGCQGTIVNVFTEPEWRRRGIASLLIREIIAFSKAQPLDRLLLHASDEGRSVYEKLGFIAGNEMRFVNES
jgi:GNAT superfamily N-acetyltransferase